MSLGRYLIGVAALLCVLGSLGVGAAAVRRYLLPDWRGAHARLAEIVTGCALLVGIMEVLGTVGLFRLVPMVVGSIAVGSALRLGLTSRSSARVVRPRAARPGVTAAVLILISVAGLVVVLLQWTGRSLRSFEHGITGADSIAYHLPHAASYAQTGQIRAIRYTDYDYLTGLYPATSELFHALGIVLMGNDVLSPGINLIWLALTLLAAWCIGSVRGFGSTSMLAAALVMATPMMVGSNAGTADNDLLGVFFVMAALALWMRTADMPTTDTRAYRGGSIIAAVAAGLALSVKLNLLGSGGGTHARRDRVDPQAAGAGARPGGGSGGWSSPVVTGTPVTSSRSGTRSRGSASAYCRRLTHRRCSTATTTPWPTTPPIPGSSATGWFRR